MISRIISFLLPLVLLLTSCSKESSNGDENKNNTLSIAISTDAKTFDPRLVRDTVSANVAHMLFDGLFRSGARGAITPAIAEGYEVSEDRKSYTFFLRESFWSDGTPLTAYDFEYSWKSMLEPDFPAPNAFQLFIIEGARDAKLGKHSLDEVGIHALDDHTLKVELQQPTPYFLELLTTHFYSPINLRWALQEDKDLSPKAMPVNGPFRLKEWRRNHQILLSKNKRYWDANTVALQGVTLMVLDETTALQMFERGELDWVGSPMGLIPPDAIATLREQERLIISPAAGVHWFRVNVEKSPLDNEKIRRALSYSLNRQALVDNILQAGQKPAMGIIPPTLTGKHTPHFADNNTTQAWGDYQEALQELKLSKDDLPEISLCYSASERGHKIAQEVQQQWKKALGITVKLESCEGAIFYDRLGQHDYQLASGSWFADIRDPINFLEIFKYKWVSTNNTQWEDTLYAALLDDAEMAATPFERAKKHNEAETLLLKAMPIIPLYYPTFNHLQNPKVSGVYFSELGYLDLKGARINP